MSDRAELEREIARKRADLQATVHALSGKLDVKSRVRAKASTTLQDARSAARDNPRLVVGVSAVGAAVALLLIVRKVRA